MATIALELKVHLSLNDTNITSYPVAFTYSTNYDE